jgi:predicted sulfurtransferase
MEDVYAIEGGVVKYVNTYNDGNWLGNLYTFDDRVSTVVSDSETHVSIGECLYTGEKTDNCVNCRYAPCNARLIATEKAYREYLGFCSLECYNGARNDSLVKVVNWDKFDYKSMGKAVRNGESSLAQEHLDKKLSKKAWKHINSQKEEVICEC